MRSSDPDILVIGCMGFCLVGGVLYIRLQQHFIRGGEPAELTFRLWTKRPGPKRKELRS